MPRFQTVSTQICFINADKILLQHYVSRRHVKVLLKSRKIAKCWHCLMSLTSMEWVNKNVQLRLPVSAGQQAFNSIKVEDLTHQFSIVLRRVYNLHIEFTDSVDREMMRSNSGNVDVKIRARTVFDNSLRQSIDLLCDTSWCWTCITNKAASWVIMYFKFPIAMQHSSI